MRLAIVGDPVSHSRSPQIHTAALEAVGIDGTYERITVPAGSFDDFIDGLRAGSFDGVNVTMPHKTSACRAVDSRSDAAERTAAVNTIVRSGRTLVGYNTDVDGITFATSALGLPPDVPILILGAGGAARAGVVALTAPNTRRVVVSARDPKRAADMVRMTATTADVLPWGRSLPGSIVVNATPIGMHGETLPDGIVEESSGLVDMVYGSSPSPAVAVAQGLGIPVSDGLSMLVGQAKGAFVLFVGVEPPAGVMEAAALR